MYVSWKHLSEEMPGKEFHPVWHALSQLVPIYNFVVVYQHFRTIREVQGRERVESNLVPGLAVVLSFISNVNGVGLWWNLSPLWWVVLSFISIIGGLTMVLWGQRNLNKYWERPGAPPVRSVSTGPGEVIITAVGGLFTGLVLLGVIFLSSPSISSVYEADSIVPIQVGSERQGSINNFFFEVDAYSFTVQSDAEYAILVYPISIWDLDGDPLEAAIVALWDSEGSTVLGAENANTPIVIRWTASSSGTRYVTIESDGAALGDYVLRIAAR